MWFSCFEIYREILYETRSPSSSCLEAMSYLYYRLYTINTTYEHYPVHINNFAGEFNWWVSLEAKGQKGLGLPVLKGYGLKRMGDKRPGKPISPDKNTFFHQIWRADETVPNQWRTPERWCGQCITPQNSGDFFFILFKYLLLTIQ